MQAYNNADYSFDFYHPKQNLANPIEHGKKKNQFNPYVNNEGTIVVISGKDFVVAAGDTRISNGYSIVSRDITKIFPLTEDTILLSSGMYADYMELQKYLKARIEIYRSTNKKDPSIDALAQLLSVTLYSRRFFPYYAFTSLCGKREDGTYTCFTYDAVGSYESQDYTSQGSGSKLITATLDNFFKRNNNITVEQAKTLVLETMNGTSCRDIYTGDNVEIAILERGKELRKETYPLRKD